MVLDVQAQAQANLRWGASIAQEYLVEGVPPERGHISALTFRFLWDFNVMLEAWATWGQRELSGWGDVEPTAERMDRAAAILREALAERLGDVAGFPECLRDFPGVAAGILRPLGRTRRRIDPDDPVGADTEVAERLADRAGLADLRHELTALALVGLENKK